MNKKIIHVIILLCVILSILITIGFMALKYYVEGETNMPFIISKMSVISSSEGIDKNIESTDNRWNFDINQNNDIYLYIDKNPQYDKTETIECITINNIKMSKKNQNGTLMLYKPDITNDDVIFTNKDENSITDELVYCVDQTSDIKSLKITNQGGLVALRFSNNNIAEYVSNDEEINHNDLLKKSAVSIEDLTFDVYFDLYIELTQSKSFKSTISFTLPLEDVIENGTSSKEFTDMERFIFKRIVN